MPELVHFEIVLARAGSRQANRLVGARIRQARQSVGLSREALAAKAGIKTCALSKYERGRYRISAGLLRVMALFLSRDVAWFFEESAHG